MEWDRSKIFEDVDDPDYVVLQDILSRVIISSVKTRNDSICLKTDELWTRVKGWKKKNEELERMFKETLVLEKESWIDLRNHLKSATKDHLVEDTRTDFFGQDETSYEKFVRGKKSMSTPAASTLSSTLLPPLQEQQESFKMEWDRSKIFVDVDDPDYVDLQEIISRVISSSIKTRDSSICVKINYLWTRATEWKKKNDQLERRIKETFVKEKESWIELRNYLKSATKGHLIEDIRTDFFGQGVTTYEKFIRGQKSMSTPAANTLSSTLLPPLQEQQESIGEELDQMKERCMNVDVNRTPSKYHQVLPTLRKNEEQLNLLRAEQEKLDIQYKKFFANRNSSKPESRGRQNNNKPWDVSSYETFSRGLSGTSP